LSHWHDIISRPAGRRVLVVGLARSGRAAASWLARQGARVTGSDQRQQLAGLEELAGLGVDIVTGVDGSRLLPGMELVVLSPGVWMTAPVVQRARQEGIPLLGELELAWRALRQRQGRALTLIAVTGTNGKSTTAALCAHLARSAGRRVFLGGNIGRPLLEILDEPGTELAVVEVSSFQLEQLSSERALDPQVAVWLNLTPDHLDRHGSLEEYAACKRRLFAGQGAEDSAVVFLDDEQVVSHTRDLPARLLGFSRLEQRAAGGVLIAGERLRCGAGLGVILRNQRLAGEHNAENAAAALLAARAAGIDSSLWQQALDGYPGLEHRLEPVAEVGGVRFINDSKGTNVDATLKSLTSFTAPIILLAGGRGKGSDFRRLRPLVRQRVKQLLLLGEEAEHLARDLDGCAPALRVSDMRQAVQQAYRLARPGDVVLLSPACASFDMFSDYAERGRVFAAAARSLAAEEHR